MNRARPVDMRKAMDMACALRDAGILFVPIPVANDAEQAARFAEAEAKLEQMAREAEAQEGVQ